MPVANGNLVSIRSPVSTRHPARHIPLAKCRVLYIGCAVPLKTSVGLEAVQKPLAELYPVNKEEKLDGIEAWVTVFTSGVHLQYVGEQDSTLWFPIQNLYVCAAVKCMTTYNNDTGEKVARFVSLDSDAAKGNQNSTHPPMFASILRRSKGVKLLECHGFIVKSNHAALSMVKACTYAYQHEENWTDEPPPADVLQHEVHYSDVNGSVSDKADSTLKRIDTQKGGYFYAGDGMVKQYDVSNGAAAPERSQSIRPPVAAMPRFVAPGPGPMVLRPGMRPSVMRPPVIHQPRMMMRPMMVPHPRMMVRPPVRILGPPPPMIRPMGPPPPRPPQTIVRVNDEPPPSQQPATVIQVTSAAPPVVEVPSTSKHRYTIKRTDSVSSRSSSGSPPRPPVPEKQTSIKKKKSSRRHSTSPSDSTDEPKTYYTNYAKPYRGESTTSTEYATRQQRHRPPPSPPADYVSRMRNKRMSRREEFELENGDAHLELERTRGQGRPVYVYYPQPDPRTRSMYVRGPYVERRYIPPGAVPVPTHPPGMIRPSYYRGPPPPRLLRAKSQPPEMRRNRSPSPMRVRDKKPKKRNKRKSERVHRPHSERRHYSDQELPRVDGFNSEVYMVGPDDHWDNMRPRDWQNEDRQFGNERAFSQSVKHWGVDDNGYNAYDMNREGPTSPEPALPRRVDYNGGEMNGDDQPLEDDMERQLGYLP